MTRKGLLHSLKKEIKTVMALTSARIYPGPKLPEDIIDKFHILYYNSRRRTWGNTFWFGIPIQKCPLDLWIYQEIIFEVKPDIIIESGTADGGSSLFLASVCDLIDKGKVITIDIGEKQSRPNHKRIKYLLGSSISGEIVEQVRKLVTDNDKTMVILDSDHRKEHVLNELKIYSKLVSKGSYIIVEDTNVNGRPVRPEFGPGPMEAVEEFVKEDKEFTIDRSREKFYLTFNPRGFLRKEK